jgi:hypothetical protein
VGQYSMQIPGQIWMQFNSNRHTISKADEFIEYPCQLRTIAYRV